MSQSAGAERSRVDDPSVRFVAISEAADYLGIAKSTAYDAVARTGFIADGVQVIRVGRRLLVPTVALRALAGTVDQR